jgi:hypothetical protein
LGAGEDSGSRRIGQKIYDALPKDQPPKFVEVPGGHFDTPDNADAIAAAWIREIAANRARCRVGGELLIQAAMGAHPKSIPCSFPDTPLIIP